MKHLFTAMLCMAVFCGFTQINVPITTDYSNWEQQYATQQSQLYHETFSSINKRWGNADNLMLDYAAVFFDTIINTPTGVYYPKSQCTLTMDSFAVNFTHQHLSGAADSIHFTVFNTSAAIVTNYGAPNATFTTPVLWDTFIVASTSLTATANTVRRLVMQPHISLPQGNSFGVRVDFSGDTANKFYLVSGYRDHCNQACYADAARAGNNSAYYLNITTPTGTNLSGYFSNAGASNIFYDCDASGSFTTSACENFPIQNWEITGYFNSLVNFGATATADSSFGCTGEQIQLHASAYGSANTPFTYQWATSSGSFVNGTTANPILILGSSNASVTVTVTDALNNTTTANVTVANRSINITINNSNPLTINCGSTATITTAISGYTTGKFYYWSTGNSGSTLTSKSVSQPGNYSVTVTNSAGCSSSATITAQFPGGLTNIASFTVPPAPHCATIPITFTNTSQRVNGWNYTWTYGDSHSSFALDGVNTYAAAGQFNVLLVIDSGGCSFSSGNIPITILPVTNGQCSAPPVLAMSSTNGCNGTGTATVTVTSGTGPFTYLWSNNATTATITNLQPGVYSVIVTGGTGMQVGASVTVNGLSLTGSSTTVNCPESQNGTITVIAANGTLPYTYSWSNGANTATINGLTAGSYSVTVTDNTACSSSAIYTVTALHPSPNVNITPGNALSFCQGDSSVITATFASGNTFQWLQGGLPITGATSQSYYVSQAGSYSVQVTSTFGCKDTSALVTATANTPAVNNFVINTGGPLTFCNGGSVTLDAGSGFNNYAWSTGANTQSIIVTQAGNYAVTVNEGNGCLHNDAVSVTVNNVYQGQEICIVTVDSVSGKNQIVWEKQSGAGIDSFVIYRETAVSGVYDAIAEQAFAEFSTFIDTGSNPQQISNRYKISTINICGESGLSTPHKTIHLTSNVGINNEVNLIWTPYEGFNYSTYYIYRGPSLSQLSLLYQTSSVNTSYTDLTPPAPPVYYQVEVVNPAGCVPTAKTTSYSSSRSNLLQLNSIGIKETLGGNEKLISYYEEGTGRNMLRVISSGKNKNVVVYDITGRKVFETQTEAEFIALPANLAPGGYIAALNSAAPIYLRFVLR